MLHRVSFFYHGRGDPGEGGIRPGAGGANLGLFTTHSLEGGEDWQDKSANTNTVEVLVFQKEIKTLKQEW